MWVLNVTAYQLSLDALRVIFRMYRTSVRCDFAQDILFFWWSALSHLAARVCNEAAAWRTSMVQPHEDSSCGDGELSL